METENWHSSFNPKVFLSRVNLDRLIERNEVYNENKAIEGSSPCIMCSSLQGPGILLNDKSYLCKGCYAEVSTISYPELYENSWRDYLTAKESRRLAHADFTKRYCYTKGGNIVAVLACMSLPLFLIDIALLVIPSVLFLVSLIIDSVKEDKLNAWLKLKDEWERKFPEPSKPTLRHFHDPQAELTQRDRKILKIFNNWPGYPPFWNYLREVVLSRDGHHCQVSGCPSRVTLHIHHQTPVSKGGEHTPDNLVSLCDFHHALEPDEGHERIWGSIKTRYFTIVRAHKRNNKASSGFHDVRAHVRRLELVTEDELNEIKNYYLFSCPECESESISISVKDKVNVECRSCHKSWMGPKELTEETGPRLAEILNIKRNKGIWMPRWNMLSLRTDSVFSSLSGMRSKSKSATPKKKQTIKTMKTVEIPLCPKCGSPMKLVIPRTDQKWKKFWGCTKYWSEGCRGSRRG